jgi:hypothetical protein
MPAAATVSDAERSRLLDMTLLSLLKKLPVVEPQTTVATRASAYYKAQKQKRPTMTYADALAEVKQLEKGVPT